MSSEEKSITVDLTPEEKGTEPEKKKAPIKRSSVRSYCM